MDFDESRANTISAGFPPQVLAGGVRNTELEPSSCELEITFAGIEKTTTLCACVASH